MLPAIGSISILDYLFLLLPKGMPMIPAKKLKISFEELAIRGARVLSQQTEITYEEALLQVQRLKKNSVVSQRLKKSR
jgi:hypothetical protein